MLRWGMILLFLPCVLLVTVYMIEAQDVARCLDGGGSWDYAKEVCDQVNKHEFVSFMSRYSIWVNGGMLLSIIGLCMGTWGMILKGMSTPKDRD